MSREPINAKAPTARTTARTPKRIDKTLQWLEESRDSWKDKTQTSKAKLKVTTLALKRAREDRSKCVEELKKERRNNLEELYQKDIEITKLKQQLEQAYQEVEILKKKEIAPYTGKPKGHTYWNSLITMTMRLLHIASLSFSGTAHALGVLQSQGNLDRVPSIETCIQWEMKLGLYKLTRSKEAADDWVWIMDHVVNQGAYKCFLVLGVRMSTLEQRKDLTLRIEDLEPLGVVPMKVSNGELVTEELEKIVTKAEGRPPLAIVKDQGSDLRCGGRGFCEKYDCVIDIQDVPHKVACLYKKTLVDDSDWNQFTAECANFKKRIQLTQNAHLAPPNQRSKARYHNIDVLIDWATKWFPYCDRYWELRWLKGYGHLLQGWSQLVASGRVVRDIVRREGISQDCYNSMSERLVDIAILPKAEQFACDILDFVEKEGRKVPNGQRMIGTSEIIESVFGVHKNVSGRGPKPMGRLILSMASRVGEKVSEPLIKTAFEGIQEATIDQWLANAFSKGTREQVEFFEEEKWNQFTVVA